MPSNFKAAGVLFTDRIHVLAGFQPGKGAVSGFGGSREGCETIRQTAFREVLEELLEPISDLRPFIAALCDRYKDHPITRKEAYRFLTLTLEDLLCILKEAKEIDLKSNIYKSIPTTIAALIQKRKPLASSEVTTIMLLPVQEAGVDLEPHFAEDIASLMYSTHPLLDQSAH